MLTPELDVVSMSELVNSAFVLFPRPILILNRRSSLHYGDGLVDSMWTVGTGFVRIGSSLEEEFLE